MKMPQATFSVQTLYCERQKKTALTVSSQEFFKEVMKILGSLQHVGNLMEVEIIHKDIFGISCHVDHLKEIQSRF